MAEETLPDDPATLKAMLLAERVRSERLEQIIKELQRHRFGRGDLMLWTAPAPA
jgi:transposase